MNSYERITMTLQGLPVDRTPVIAVLGIYGCPMIQQSIQSVYSNHDLYCKSQEITQEVFQPDCLISPFDYSIIAEAFGCEVAWYDNQAPNIKKYRFKNGIDLLKAPLPGIEKTGRLGLALQITKTLSKKYNKQIPVFSIVPGPLSVPALLLGLENWIEIVLFNEKLKEEVLEHLNRFYVNWCNRLLSSGCMALVITEGIATEEIMNHDLFKSILYSHLRESFNKIKGPIIFHHTGGRILHNLDLISDLPNVIGIAISSKDDIQDSIKKIKNNQLIIGNIDNLSMPSMSEEEIYTKSIDLLEKNQNRGRFVLSNSGADIPINTPIKNIHAMIRASKDFSIRGNV